MGDISIRFRMNLKTGEKEIVVRYEDDEDLMRHEHEKRHREIVKKLVGDGVLNAEDSDNIVVERVTGSQQETQSQNETQGEAQASSQ